MDMTPQEIAGTTFRVVKKGFDPEEVRIFQLDAARSLEAAQTQAAMMEQRARAAVAKAQGLAASLNTESTPAPAPAPAVTSSVVAMRADDAEIISRTLVLAQQTADRAVADANQQAATIRESAEADAADILEEARGTSALLVAEARTEARRAGEAERGRINNEVQALLARLDFLRGDVAAMEVYATSQRQRLLEVSETLRALTEEPTLGLNELNAPILSSAADIPRDPNAPVQGSLAGIYDENVEASAPIGRTDATPGDGNPVLPPPAGVQAPLAEMPTGELPAIRPTSGPVAVPDLDAEWDDDPFPDAPAPSQDLRIRE